MGVFFKDSRNEKSSSLEKSRNLPNICSYEGPYETKSSWMKSFGVMMGKSE